MLSQIAIPTQYLNTSGPTDSFQGAVEDHPPLLFVASQLLSMLSSVTFNVVKCEKSPIRFSATRADTPISQESLLSRFNMPEFMNATLCFCALITRFPTRAWRALSTRVAFTFGYLTPAPISSILSIRFHGGIIS